MDNGILRELPNMNALLAHSSFAGLARPHVKRAAQRVLAELRSGILSGSVPEIPSLDECAARILAEIEKTETANLRGVINATGIVLHTNLGRAPLGDALYSAAAQVYRGYSNLEYDLETGQRGSRYSHIENLVCELTGAEAAMVVNNNAAAVFIMLTTLAKGKRVAISRGELVEIGGSFRIPEIMEQSGAELMEVGATNKTRLSDYSRAVANGAEILLKVHASNYEIVGFTESVSVAELSAFGRENGLPVLYDMGSCFMTDPEPFGFHFGETARGGIEAGADIICFSGDKLLGSMQAGIMAGRREYIVAIKKHPLARALRADKLTLAALEATLRICLYPEEAKSRIPVLAMLFAEPEELERRALSLAGRLRAVCPVWTVGVCSTADETGGGSLPNVQLSGWAVTIEPAGLSVQELERRLRRGRIPVIIRINGGVALISLRTLLPGEEEAVTEAVRSVYEGDGA
ncbi:MAG: L-seryl-tRNA(Sec) selenium transferase [Oscillospiraceae bacterium]|jgi:L-seryl-tRNA(Ser) seleniumtransferase|nr:L-seryl-tRNA(Sec) selenium transferase [Oscillospiraceae bacterium]